MTVWLWVASGCVALSVLYWLMRGAWLAGGAWYRLHVVMPTLRRSGLREIGEGPERLYVEDLNATHDRQNGTE